MKRQAFAVWVCMVMIASGFVMVEWTGGGAEGEEIEVSPMYTLHAPISISGDMDFYNQAIAEGWAGNGTSANPYIIEGYDIDGSVTWYCIEIDWTSVYFVVRDCYLHSTESGIRFFGVQNGKIESNIINNNGWCGIYFQDSNSNIIIRNTISNNWVGLYCNSSSSNTIVANNVSNNQYGMYLWGSNSNIHLVPSQLQIDEGTGGVISLQGDDVSYYSLSSPNSISAEFNTALSDAFYDITAAILRIEYNNPSYTFAPGYTTNPFISFNYSVPGSVPETMAFQIAQNQVADVLLQTDIVANVNTFSQINQMLVNFTAHDDIVNGNNPINISFIALDLTVSSRNTIYYNNFINNAQQAIDDIGTNQWDDGYPSGGNYWSDYNGTDGNSDGIGDTPYYFDGGQDDYPLMEPWNPEPAQMPHAPIRINSNADFSAIASSGDGSTGNPWIIEGWDIDGTGYGYCIYVGNTTDYFVVRECFLHDAYNMIYNPPFCSDAGITLYNSINGLISRNTFSSNMFGIFLWSSSNYNAIMNNTVINNWGIGIFAFSSCYNLIRDNIVSGNSGDGIDLEFSNNNFLINNTISNCRGGIHLWFSLDNTLLGNLMENDGIIIDGNIIEQWNTHIIDTTNIVNNKPVQYWKNQIQGTIPSGAGQVILGNCTGITIENQNVSENSCGIELGFSSDNIIRRNMAKSNDYYGIYLRCSTNNIIEDNILNFNTDIGLRLAYSSNNNTLINNTATSNYYGIFIISSSYNLIYHNNALTNINQACDDSGLNIWDDGYPSGGNYWSDYNGTDGNGDGIGDWPYYFDGGQDNYPLMEPWNSEPAQIPHQPIRINSNADFTLANGVSGGNGSAIAPWIIENWDIDGTGYGYCIYIGNTTEFFEVRECYLHHASGAYNPPYYPNSGLSLSNVS